MGRAGLINSGGASAGESDLKDAVKTAVINKPPAEGTDFGSQGIPAANGRGAKLLRQSRRLPRQGDHGRLTAAGRRRQPVFTDPRSSIYGF